MGQKKDFRIIGFLTMFLITIYIEMVIVLFSAGVIRKGGYHSLLKDLLKFFGTFIVNT